MAVTALAAASGAAIAADAAEPTEPGADRFLERVWASVKAELEAAAERNARKPPVPRPVKWRVHKEDDVELGASLLAITGAPDLDGNSVDELIALTTREVLVLERRRRRRVDIVARASLPPQLAPVRSRDPVGTLVVSDGEILARTSDQAVGVALRLDAGALVQVRTLPGYPVCPGAVAALVQGKNYFSASGVSWSEPKPPDAVTAVSDDFFSAACPQGLVDPAGNPLQVFGYVDTGRVLHVACARETGRCPVSPVDGREFTGVGYAFAVADVDNDGYPEVATSRGGVPGGNRDWVRVYSQRGGRIVRVVDREFLQGVAGLAAGDFDGDGGVEMISAVRGSGQTRVTLWTLD